MGLHRAWQWSLAAALALGLAHTVRADVIVFDASPATPATLQAAVDLAADGDMILIHAFGLPLQGETVIDGKGLTLAPLGVGVPRVAALTVRNLSVDQTVVLRGFGIRPDQAPVPPDREGLIVEDCAGQVRLEDCLVRGPYEGPHVPMGRAAVLLDDAGRVVITASQLRGSGGPGQAPDGLIVTGASRVALYDTLVHAGSSFTSPGSGGSSGVRMAGETLDAMGGVFLGLGDGPSITVEAGIARLADVNLNSSSGIASVVAPGAELLELPHTARHFAAASPLGAGDFAQLEFEGELGETVFLWVSPTAGQTWVPAVQGLLLVGRPVLLQHLLITQITTLDDPATVSAAVPPLPPGTGHVDLVLQAVFVDGDTVVAGPSQVLTLLEPDF